MQPEPIYAWELSSTWWPDARTVLNARSRGEAKYAFWLDVRDAWQDFPFTAIRCRKLGGPQTTERLQQVAEYRRMPQVQGGDRVAYKGHRGTIIDGSTSANFKVLFDLDTPYKGNALPVHPCDLTFLPAEGGNDAA